MRVKVIEKGPWEGREAELEPGRGVTLGADPSCTLSFPGAPGVEGTHCVIRALKQGGFGVKDLGSQEGTFLNGKRVQVARLHPGDLLRVGSVTLEVLDGEDGGPESAMGEKGEEEAEEKAPAGGRENPPGPQAGPKRGKLPPRKRDLERVGTEIGGYKILEFLGRGGMGTVFRALQVSLQREVALKILRRERTRDPAFVEGFVREARAAARFNHPNVVHVYDVGNEGDVYFYSMELMDRGSLEEELAERGKLPWQEALDVIRQAARGLRYAEEMGVVHRDIKPDNLMRNSQGAVKIADLGLAATAGEAGEAEEGGKKKKIFGTPHFISPEQARGEPVDGRSDIYSLGCTFYRLVTGRTPFQGESVREILKKHFTEDPEPASQVEPSVPDAVSRVIQKMMAKDPAERYQTAQELLADLDRLSRKEGGKKWILLLVLAVLAAGAIALALRKPKPVIIQKPSGENAAFREKFREMERAQRELKAKNAFLGAKDLPDGETKAARLEKIAKDFAGTEAAEKAAALAASIRADLARKEKARKEREARVRAFLAALKDALARAGKAGDGRIFFRAVPSLPHMKELAKDPGAAGALAEAERKAAGLLTRRLRDLLSGAGTLLKKGDLEGCRKALEESRALLSDPVLPPGPRKALEKHFSGKIRVLEKALAAEKEKRRALQARADRRIYLEGLFRGKDSVLEKCANLDFSGALAAARALEKKLRTKPFLDLLRARIPLLERAGRAWKAFLADLASGRGGPLKLEGKTWRILSYRKGGPLVLEEVPPGRSGRKTRRKKGPARMEVPLGRSLVLDRPALLAALLDPGRRETTDPEALADLAALCAWLGPLPLAKEARQWMKKIRPGDPKSGLSSSPPSFASPLLDLAGRIAGRAALPPSEADLVRREIRAGVLLSRGLRDFALGRNLEARAALESIASRFADSGIYGLLGEGSALDPGRPSAPPGK